MLIKSILLLLPLCHGTRESRKQYKSPHSVNINGLANDLSQNSPFDYAYNDELDYNFFPSYEGSDGHDPFYDLDSDGFDNTDDRGGTDYYTDYDYYYDEDPNHESGHLAQKQNVDYSVFYDSFFGDGDSVIPEESHLPAETNSENYKSSSISTTSTTPKPISTSSTTQKSQQRFRPLHIPAHLISKPKIGDKKEELSNEYSTTTALPKLRPLNIPAHFITKPKLHKKTPVPNEETERKTTNDTDSASLPTRLRPLDIPDEFISLPKPAKPDPTIKFQLANIKETLSKLNYSETSTKPKPSTAVKKPSKSPLNVMRLKQIMPLVLKQLGLPSSMASSIFENEEAVNKLVKQLDKMDDFKGLLQHLDLGALASMMSGTDASVALNLLQGSNLGSMTGILKTIGIDTSYIDGIFNRIGAAAAPPSTKAEGDDSKFLYLPLVDSGSVSNVQVIGFVVLLLFLLTTAYAYMEYGLLDATGGTGGSYSSYDTSYTAGDGYDRYTTGGHPAQQSLGWSDGSGLWLPVLESAEADAYYYPGPDPPEDEHLQEYSQPYEDSADQYEPWRQPEESYYQIQRETQPREPEETYYESHVEDEIEYTPKRPYNRFRQKTQRPRRPTTTTTTQIPRRTTTTTTQRPRRPTTSTRWGGRFPTETKERIRRPNDGQSHARRPASTQNRRVYTTRDQNRRHSIGYRERAPVVYRYSGNRRYSNNRDSYYKPSDPKGYLQLVKPKSVPNSNRRRGVSNRRRITDDRPSYDEYYEDYQDPDHYEYDYEYSDYTEYSDDYYDDDQTDTVTEGRANSDQPPYEPLKLNSFNGQIDLSALSQLPLSMADKDSTIISSTTSSVTANTPSTTIVSSSSSPTNTSTSKSASTTTPNPDVRPTSKIISTIKQRRTDTFSDEHSQDWLRFIHKLA